MLSHVEEDAHAYFGLFTQNQLLSVVNMCPEFKTGSVEFDYGTWLQSVTCNDDIIPNNLTCLI